MADADLVLIGRSATPPGEVVAAVEAQVGVRLTVHRVVGVPRPGDANRWETIARARNAGKPLGTSPRLMYLDDDVVPEPDCVRRLIDGLNARPGYAALAADYLGECGAGSDGAAGHVGMGCTLFRRESLARVRFRWSPGRCECQCCCDDLRARGRDIGYFAAARARHVESLTAPHAEAAPPRDTPPDAAAPQSGLAPRVLVAFDRRHLPKFRRQFLGTLRASGNAEPVTAVTYGLYPSERGVLGRTPGVEVFALPDTGVMPPVRRLRDFQAVLERWPGATPVAYWDAGDVMFQGRLGPLWDLVRANPGRLLAVREPVSHPENLAVARWTLSVRDPVSRRLAFDLLSSHPFLNSGFAAGTARSLRAYFREADEALRTSPLAGSSDWGDQTALNLYCHSHPDRWLEVAPGWNYCLLDRPTGAVRVRQDGRIVASGGEPIFVAHGNAQSLRQFAISRRLV